MFRSFIYLDEEKMYSYLRQIDKEFAGHPSKVKTKKAKSGRVSVSALELKTESETEARIEYEKDVFNDYHRFESELNLLGAEEYFDFVLNSDYDIKTVPPMSIIRVSGRIEIPEQFDIISLAQPFMPHFSKQLQNASDDAREILEAYLRNASADIPVLIGDEEVIISGKLRTDSLLEPHSELEEYAEQDVFALCKVIGLVNKEHVEIFNPLKDFIKFPRAFRRAMDDSSTDVMEKIVVSGPVLKVEVIGIYK